VMDSSAAKSNSGKAGPGFISARRRSGLSMKPESMHPALEAERCPAGLGVLPVYLELGKARLSTLVVITAFAGFMLAGAENLHPGLLFWTLLGTGLAALGANAFNQWREAALDARMERTRRRMNEVLDTPAGQAALARLRAAGLID